MRPGSRSRGTSSGGPADQAAAPAAQDQDRFAVCPAVFGDLYARHYPDVLAQSRRFARRPDDAPDIAHDAFVRALAAAPRTGIADPAAPWGPAQAGTYLRTTVANLGADRWRASQRRPDPVHLDAVPEDAHPQVAAEDPVVKAETAAQVRTGLSLIPPQHRDALVLREVHELAVPDIAGRLGIEQGNVKHLLSRARKSLRRVLAPVLSDAA